MAIGYVTGLCYTMSNGIKKYGNPHFYGIIEDPHGIVSEYKESSTLFPITYFDIYNSSDNLIKTFTLSNINDLHPNKEFRDKSKYLIYRIVYNSDNYSYVNATLNTHNTSYCGLYLVDADTFLAKYPFCFFNFDKIYPKYKSQNVFCAVKCDFTNESLAAMFMGMVEFKIYKSEREGDKTYSFKKNKINDFPLTASLTKTIKADSAENVFDQGNSDLGINLKLEFSKNMLYENINGSISFTPSVTFNSSEDYRTALIDFQNNSTPDNIWYVSRTSVIFYAASTELSPVGRNSIIVTCEPNSAVITITFNNCPSYRISEMFRQAIKFTAVAQNKNGKDYGPRFDWKFTF